MADVDFSNEKSAERWFETQSVEMRCVITSRAALRVLANVGLIDDTRKEALTLYGLRAILSSAGRGLGRPSDVKELERSARSAASAASATYSAYSAVDSAYSAADSAASARSTAYSAAAYSAYSAADSAYSAAYSVRSAADSAAASARSAAASARSAADSALSFDADQDVGVLRSRWVWAGADVPQAIEDTHVTFLTYLQSHDDWRFWHRWYSQMWEGTFDDWDLAIEVATIPDAAWEEGLSAVAEAIREIEARLALGPEIRALRMSEAHITSEDALPPRGHNNPPELIDGPQMVTRVEVVWTALDTLEAEAEADTPDLSKASEALLVVRDWFFEACKYIGRKADLVIDTTVKWVIPVAGTGYLATHPDKIQKVIELAETWLRF